MRSRLPFKPVKPFSLTHSQPVLEKLPLHFFDNDKPESEEKWLKWLRNASVSKRLSERSVEVKDGVYFKALLVAAVLKDLYEHSFPDAPQPETKKNKKIWIWRLLVAAGILVAGCEGFDGVAAILGLFSVIPAILVFIVSGSFALLSLLVFYSFDLKEISQNLNISFKNSGKLLDVYAEQAEIIAQYIKALEEKIIHDPGAYAECRSLIDVLQQKENELEDTQKKYQDQLQKRRLRALKFIVSAVTGALFFASGFFAGGSVALQVACAFVAVSSTFWPILLVGLVTGIAAFSIYWFVQRPKFEDSMSAWVGLDQEKIAALSQNKQPLETLDDHLKTLLERNESQQSQVEVSVDSKKTQAQKPEASSHCQKPPSKEVLCSGSFFKQFPPPGVLATRSLSCPPVLCGVEGSISSISNSNA